MGIQQMIMMGGPYGTANPPAASGGTVVEAPNWRMHVFTSPGTLTINNPTNFPMYVACVGGGGGGGCDSYANNRGAGGGGGGGVSNPPGVYTFVAGSSYPVVVGAGGPAPVNDPSPYGSSTSVTNNPRAPWQTPGSNEPMNINGGNGGLSRLGGPTSPLDIQAGGGAGGAAHNSYPGPFNPQPSPTGGPGSANIYNQGTPAPSIPFTYVGTGINSPTGVYGSGGGGSNGQNGGGGGPLGSPGGSGGPFPHGTGGGGGGAGAPGGNGPSTEGGAGGAGKALTNIPTPIAADLLTPINVGASGLFGGGGGGKGSLPTGGAGGPGGGGAGWAAGPPDGNSGAGTDGTANTGGGGGGSRMTPGGAGGSGVVICYYPY